MSVIRYCESPLGRILLVAEESGLSGLYFVGQKYYPAKAEAFPETPVDALLDQAAAELTEYFAGKRQTFDVRLALKGTPFQKAVWQAIARVPYGQTTSYANLAKAMGIPTSVRAVATAVGRNPVSIVIPCHRIIGSDGSLTGYAGGLDRKRELLALEETGYLLASPANAARLRESLAQAEEGQVEMRPLIEE